MSDIQQYQRAREKTRRERDRLYAALGEEANPLEAMEARISRGVEEAVDAFLEESPRQRTPFRPKPRIEGRADRLRVLFEKVTKDVSLLTLRNIYDKARKLVKRDDEFRDLRALPPTQAETRELQNGGKKVRTASPSSCRSDRRSSR